MDQTSTADSAAVYIRAKRAMSSRVAPDASSRSLNDSDSSSWSSWSNPVVCSRTNARSMPPAASMTLSTPFRNAMSPQVWTPKNSSAIFVPNIALSALLGTQ